MRKGKSSMLLTVSLIVIGVLFAGLAMTGYVAQGSSDEKVGLVVILDASGSMEGEKIEGAKNHLLSLLPRIISSKLDTALRVFGWNIPNCVSELVVGFGPSNNLAHNREIEDVISLIYADNSTPITDALEKAGEDVSGYSTRRILLITDGADNCGGDAALVASQLVGCEIKVYGVGYGITEEGRALLSAITAITGGEYYEATTREELRTAVAQAVTHALSELQGWVEVYNDSSYPVWVFAHTEFKDTLQPGDVLRFTSFPGEIWISATPYTNPRVGQCERKVFVIEGTTTEAHITFGD